MVYLDYFFTLYGTSLSIEGLTDDEFLDLDLDSSIIMDMTVLSDELLRQLSDFEHFF